MRPKKKKKNISKVDVVMCACICEEDFEGKKRRLWQQDK
jgi:hypothetical protein